MSRARIGRLVTSLPTRLAVTLVLLGALATAIDWRAVGDKLAAGQWGLFVLAVAILVASLVIAALRWHVLLRSAEVPCTRLASVRAYMIGTFTNTFLPQLGGDAARAWLVGRSRSALTRAVVSVLVDRLTALACLLLLAWIVLVPTPAVPSALVVALAVTTGLAVVGAALATLAARRGVPLLERTLPERLKPSAREAERTLSAYAHDRRLPLPVLGLGLAYQVLVVLATWLIARSIDVDASFAVLAVMLPVVLVITLIPISVGGFGLREGGFVVFLADAGVSTGDATLLSLLAFAAVALASLPGAVAMLLPAGRFAVSAEEGAGSPMVGGGA